MVKKHNYFALVRIEKGVHFQNGGHIEFENIKLYTLFQKTFKSMHYNELYANL